MTTQSYLNTPGDVMQLAASDVPLWPRIRCAQCDKPVDRIEWHDDRLSFARIISVYCHGDRDTMELTDECVQRRGLVDQIMQQEGVAFTTHRIDGQTPNNKGHEVESDLADIDTIKLRVRAQDPVTSVSAAERSLKFSASHKGRILAALENAGTATALEIGLAAGLSVEQVDRRLPELARDNLAEVLRIGDADVTRDGFRVWRLKKICATAQQNEGGAT